MRSRPTPRRAWRERLFFYVRARVGLDGPLIEVCRDPENAQTPEDSPTRIVHADLPVMLAGGVASLLTQMLHPTAMRALAEHSRYEADPLGRLYNTGRFLAITTFASREDASGAISAVRRIHDQVVSSPTDPNPYYASDPELLMWVHAAETAMFLRSWQRFGPRPLSDAQADRYVADMGRTGAALGVVAPPQSTRELSEVLADYLPRLALTDHARHARDFLLAGTPYTGRLRHWGFDRVLECAISLLEAQHRALLELTDSRLTPLHALTLRSLRFAGRREL